MKSVLNKVGIATMMGIAFIAPGRAQTAGAFLLGPSSPITINSANDPTIKGWTIVLAGCGTSSTASETCAGSEVIPTVSNTALGITLSLVFESSTGGALQTSGVSNRSDMSFASITVTAPTGMQIYSTQVNVNGSDPTNPARVTVSETVTDGATVLPGLGTNPTLSPTLQSQTFAPNNVVSAQTDFRAGTIAGTETATMTSATLTYTAVPEPVSSSLLGVGIAGLGFVRRKIRRG